MRRTRILAMTGTVAIAAATLTGVASASAQPTMSTEASTAATVTTPTQYVVLVKEGQDAKAVAAKLAGTGTKVTNVNAGIGLISVTSTSSTFLRTARATAGVVRASREGVVGRSPRAAAQGKIARDAVQRPQASDPNTAASGKRSARTAAAETTGDPLDTYLWGMRTIKAPEAHRTQMGDRRVKVGIMDTGVDARHPDLRANVDFRLSRNFTTDMPDIDGPCEYASCQDPATVDNDGHGTHVAGTIAASMNGMGLSGVAPNVSLVNVRAGQDSGYFFLGATANALTYSGDAGLDVVNMSFYVDPWAYNCLDGAPEDTPEQAQEQNMIIETMRRALNYAHRHGVTLVGALGNGHDDLANPRQDLSSPDYPEGAAHPRTISNATCWDLPVEGPHVIGVSSVGPSERKADYSNWTTDIRSGEIEVAAPGGWYRDGFGTDTYRTNGNLILSTAPRQVLVDEGAVDKDGNITPDGEALGVMKACTTTPVKGADSCGYYQYLQGTSMASPHAAGVAALIVSTFGGYRNGTGFGMDASLTRKLLMGTARDKGCPWNGKQEYLKEGRTAEFTALCVGTSKFNGFYGDGIVNAARAVRR